jgi:ABC-type dipeptide/oligopeptide/nickel transport system permease component
VQYTNYMLGVLQGNWGVPYQSPGETVISLLQQAWLPSLILGGSGVIIGAALGILIGIAAALQAQQLGRLPRIDRCRCSGSLSRSSSSRCC